MSSMSSMVVSWVYSYIDWSTLWHGDLPEREPFHGAHLQAPFALFVGGLDGQALASPGMMWCVWYDDIKMGVILC